MNVRTATGRPGERACGLDAAEVPAPVLGDTGGRDVAFPGCVLVPAAPDTTSDQAVPVHGLLRLSSMQLAAKNVRFGGVVRNAALGEAVAALALVLPPIGRSA